MATADGAIWAGSIRVGLRRNGRSQRRGPGHRHGGDRIPRANAATGEIVEYLMSVYTDARKVVVDPSTRRTRLWFPNKNLAQLIPVEPQD